MSRWTERAEYFKSVQRCVRCGKQDAYTMNGHQRCYECSEKCKEYAQKHHKQNREKHLEVMHERYERLKAQGLCVECGKKAIPGFVRCQRCAIKNNLNCHKWLANKERSAENG
jgi:hypothetical protein